MLDRASCSGLRQLRNCLISLYLKTTRAGSQIPQSKVLLVLVRFCCPLEILQ